MYFARPVRFGLISLDNPQDFAHAGRVVVVVHEPALMFVSKVLGGLDLRIVHQISTQVQVTDGDLNAVELSLPELAALDPYACGFHQTTSLIEPFSYATTK